MINTNDVCVLKLVIWLGYGSSEMALFASESGGWGRRAGEVGLESYSIMRRRTSPSSMVSDASGMIIYIPGGK